MACNENLYLKNKMSQSSSRSKKLRTGEMIFNTSIVWQQFKQTSQALGPGGSPLNCPPAATC